jgi:hypothetical protein
MGGPGRANRGDTPVPAESLNVMEMTARYKGAAVALRAGKLSSGGSVRRSALAAAAVQR